MNESLEELVVAFEQWRAAKKSRGAKLPEELLNRARNASEAYGLWKVAVALKVRPHRLRQVPANAVRHPTYSKIVPKTFSRVFAEIETMKGLKIRFFDATPESLKLLGAVCGEAVLQ